MTVFKDTAVAPHAKADYFLNRIGCAGRMPIRLNDDATEQANRDLLAGFEAKIREWFEGYCLAEELNAADPDKSALKIDKDLVPIKQRFNVEFNKIAARCRQLQLDHMARVKKIESSTDAPPAGDPVLLFLRAQEVRNYLRTLTPGQVLQLLIDSDDFIVVYAIESSPSCLEILAPELLERGKRARTKRLHGKQLMAEEDVNHALTRVNEWLNAVPKIMDFVTIAPVLWKLPETVFDDPEPGEAE